MYEWISSPQSGVEGLNEYWCTQRLAIHLQSEGYDGILFESSADHGGMVGALFCPEGKDPVEFFYSVLEFAQCDMERVGFVLIEIDSEYGADKTVFLLGNKESCFQ